MNKLVLGFLLGSIIVVFSVAVHAEDIITDDVEDDEDNDGDPDAPEVPEGMTRENMVKYSAPEVNDEEAHSTRLPRHLKCDGCTAVAFQMSTIMSAFHDQRYGKKGKMAPESAVIELMENICNRKTFENYGLKSMNGLNRISGPGTAAVDEPGMMQGGGRWPYRLESMCGELVGELDEYEIYQHIVQNGADTLFALLCKNPEDEMLNTCGVPKRKDEL